MKLNFTRKEVAEIKEKVYFTEQEEKILEYWSLDYSVVMIADLLNISTSTVTRRKQSIREKLKRIKAL